MLDVSESTVKRWTDDGTLPASRTAGGHRRIAVADGVRFIRASGVPVRHPGLLGLPERLGIEAGDVPPADRLLDLLVGDDPPAARAYVMGLYVAGWSIPALCDGPLREALVRLGERWHGDPAGIFLEHRATETCHQILLHLRAGLAAPDASGPVALGGAPAGDPYALPSAMAGLVLADVGFRERNLGPNTPLAAMRSAVAHHRPRIVWQALSVVPARPAQTAADLGQLAEDVAAGGGVLVIGGRGVEALPPQARPAGHVAGSMTELAAFARGLLAAEAHAP